MDHKESLPIESLFKLATQTPVGRLQTLSALCLIIGSKGNRRLETELSNIFREASDRLELIITEEEIND